MNPVLITPVKMGQPCGICKEPIANQWSQFDKELKTNICSECSTRVMIATGYLAASGLKKCVARPSL